MFVKGNAGLLDALGLCDIGVVGGAKEVGVTKGIGDGGKGFVGLGVFRVKVSDKDDIVGGLELVQSARGDGRDRRKRLFGHV